MEISLALHMFAAAADDDDSSGLGQALTWAILALRNSPAATADWLPLKCQECM